MEVHQLDINHQLEEKKNINPSQKQIYFRKSYLRYSKNCGKVLSDCTKLGCLQNVGNSCYLDSVLFALLAIQNDFIDNNILFKHICKTKKTICDDSPDKDYNLRKIFQLYLIAITRSIRLTKDIKECTTFRKIMNKCQINGMPNFGNPGQQEAGEYLIYLLKLFNCDELAKTKTITYASNSLRSNIRKKSLHKTSTIINKKASIIQFIDSFTLMDKIHQKNKLHIFLNQSIDSEELDKDNLFKYKNKNYKRRIQDSELLDAPYLIFWAQRADPVYNIVVNTKIIPNKYLNLKSKRTLYLSSIVIHIGRIDYGHYITYFKYKKKWYMYDDMTASITPIGKYQNMLKHYPSPITNGVLYFYSS